ncbi:MAG: PIG-L family deacetylase [Acidobacteria bacterium]|nr:PIG-L family deacetylase [Acidobacteriota bacterium]
MRRFILFAVLPLAAVEPLPEDRGAPGLFRALKRLQTTARVLHVVAHPDDEDAATVTYLSRGVGADVAILSLTRGESGANLITGDFFDRLGLLRTFEFERAAQYYGASLRFTRSVDYGYSKNVAETFRKWDRRAVLRDVVREIRLYRPHVVLSRWQGTPRDGHGNHEAAGLLAREAFAAAADPAAFADLGLPVWQASKLYSDNRNALDDWTVRVEHGVVDPLLGRSYSQFGREGYRMHRSQGAGAASARPGPSFSYYKLLASTVGDAAKEASFLERIDVAAKGEFASRIAEARRVFDLQNPGACVPALTAALRTGERSGLVRHALALALGLQLEVRVDPKLAGPVSPFRAAETVARVVPGQTLGVTVKLHGAVPRRTTITGPANLEVKDLGDGKFSVRLPEGTPHSVVPWRRESVHETAYRWDAKHEAAPWIATVTYDVNGVESQITAPVLVTQIDPLGVEKLKPVAVAPPIAVKFSAEFGVLPLTASEYELRCNVTSNVDGQAAGTVRLALPSGWSSEAVSFALEREREEATLRFRIQAPPGRSASETAVRAVAEYKGREYSESFEEIGESIYMAVPARHVIRSVDVRVSPGLRTGYVMGTGDDVPEGLRQLGVPVEMLDASALASGDLGRYSTILLGIRAYAARADVKTYNARLLQYVANGGVLVVQYNTPEFDRNFGPFPYTMGRNPEEVSEEDSPVEMLNRKDPVFLTPNRITNDDFKDWVEQRGSKFLTSWDPRYTPLLETHDTGQAQQKGGWLVARHGKGLYVYCAYAWYRQLPYAVPGAVRLFANLVSLGAKESAWRER